MYCMALDKIYLLAMQEFAFSYFQTITYSKETKQCSTDSMNKVFF